MQKARFVGTILGKQGSGKSHLAEEKIIKLLKANSSKPIFILDTMDEYGSYESGKAYGVCYYNMYSLKKHLIEVNKNLTGVHVLKADNDSDCENFFKLFTKVKQPCTIIIEEASKFCNPYSINDDLDNILNYGRHWEQDIIFLARRPAELHRSVTAQSDFIISFVQTESRDINSLKKSYDIAEYLPMLIEEDYEYVVLGKLPDRLEDLEDYTTEDQLFKRVSKS